MNKKQVEKTHYEFNSYMTKNRWGSIWHQVDEIQRVKPENVLEIGLGSGLLKTALQTFGFKIETLDIDPDLKPDHVGSVTNMHCPHAFYDVVCAFQILEHLPYEVSLQAFIEMVRVSRHHVIISLPDAKNVWYYRIHLPKFGAYNFFIPRPQLCTCVHKFDGEHYWEINKRDYPLSRVIADFSQHICLIKTYRVWENPYHRFFVFSKK